MGIGTGFVKFFENTHIFCKGFSMLRVEKNGVRLQLECDRIEYWCVRLGIVFIRFVYVMVEINLIYHFKP